METLITICIGAALGIFLDRKFRPNIDNAIDTVEKASKQWSASDDKKPNAEAHVSSEKS